MHITSRRARISSFFSASAPLSLLLFSTLFLEAAKTPPSRQNPSRFEKEIQAFEAADRTNPPPKGAVLFVGSSSIRLWTNLTQSFPQLTIIQRGFGGSCVPDSTAYADRIIFPYRPSKIVLYAGDNDIARGDSPAEIADHFRAFVHKVQSALPAARIYFIAVKPSPSRWPFSPQAVEVNRTVRDYCASHNGLKYIDVWEPMLDSTGHPDPTLFRADNLHLNGKGYELWTKIIGSSLKDN
jgi:lysophospholipase L1-like esterase